jgi:putative MATE family efflux protein
MFLSIKNFIMHSNKNIFQKVFSLIKQSFVSENQDFTTGSINKAIVLLAIPMLMEMLMESLFAVVDTFFVSKLGTEAIATVGLTESMLTIVYSIGIGISMAATAIVARRVGEKNYRDASKAGAQAITLGVSISMVITIVGILFAEELLHAMGASTAVIEKGSNYTRIVLASNVVIMLLFLINGVFRGAGNVSLAFRSLFIANCCNIIFCPFFITGFGIFPGLGLTGAAIATLCGRSIGVMYQLAQLNKKQGFIQIYWTDYLPNKKQIVAIVAIAWSATLQFVIASGSWIFLNRLMASFGDDAVAGYTIAIRILIFFIMPAWGISNAAATMVGQNLGAGLPDRAEKSVWQTAKVNAVFMAFVTVTCLLAGHWTIRQFTTDPKLVTTAQNALQVVTLGYIVYGIGMVILNAFNGAGDSKTPSLINFFGYWCFQIPLAWVLSHQFGYGKNGIFYSIIITETVVMITSLLVFKKGKWKKVQV